MDSNILNAAGVIDSTEIEKPKAIVANLIHISLDELDNLNSFDLTLRM